MYYYYNPAVAPPKTNKRSSTNHHCLLGGWIPRVYIYIQTHVYMYIVYHIKILYLHHVFHVITPWLSSFQVEPVAGLALWWPNVHDDLGTDFRTRHEAQTVQQGVKWVANLWLHQYDFRGPYSHLSWMGDEAREELGAFVFLCCSKQHECSNRM